MDPPKTQIVLPARLASTRLKEKLLRVVAGRSILEHTYHAASQAKSASAGVIVAVDDPRLAELVDSFGGRWIMTSPDCPSGTDRIAEVARELTDVEVFVNVQGDEPEIDPDAIDAVAELVCQNPGADMATCGTPIRHSSHLNDPAVVKIVMGCGTGGGEGQGSESNPRRAIYFSRAAVPFCRDAQWEDALTLDPPAYWHHLGLYAYRREFLTWFAAASVSTLESLERLEQLRAIEAGKQILVASVGPAKPGIDTEEDLQAFRDRIEKC